MDEDIQKLNDIIASEKGNEFAISDSECSEYESDIEIDNSLETAANFDTQIDIPDLLDSPELTNISNLDPLSLQAQLTEEELDLINGCTDPQLKQLLLLNRQKHTQLKYLNNKYYHLLIQCKNNLKYEFDLNNKRREVTHRKASYGKVGCPYFRDAKLFPCPANSDIIKKRKNSEININYLPKRRGWNISTQSNLKSKIILNYIKNLSRSYESELCILSKKKKNNFGKILELETKIQEIKADYTKIPLPALWDDKYLDWDEIATKQYNDIHSANTSRAIWNLIIHPSVNKSPFTKNENDQIIELVNKYQCQNWEAIARELGNNRSLFLVCIQYFSKLLETSFGAITRFTEAEDETLMDFVENARVGTNVQWSKIAYYIGNRTRTQLYHRYKQKMSITNKKIGKFSEKEDVLLLCLAKKYYEDFNKIAIEMPHRNKAQLFSRYNEYLKQTHINYSSWTIEEDIKILEHVKNFGQKAWAKVGPELSRTRATVRHRYNVLQKYLSNPDAKLEDLPRRHNHNAQQTQYLHQIAKSAEEYIKSDTLPLIDHMTSTTSKGRPARGFIDAQLINFFRTTAHLKKVKPKGITNLQNIEKCGESVQTVLDMLGVKLKIPENLDEFNLNENDLEILTILAKQDERDEDLVFIQTRTSPFHESDMPPNVTTIQALRCLLLKYQEYISSRDYQPYKKKSQGDNIDAELDIFVQRFKALFRWPSLMSIVEPPEEVMSDNAACNWPKVQPKKQYVNKIQLMNQARLKKLKAAKLAKAASNIETVPSANIDLPATCTSNIDLPATSTSYNDPPAKCTSNIDLPAPSVFYNELLSTSNSNSNEASNFTNNNEVTGDVDEQLENFFKNYTKNREPNELSIKKCAKDVQMVLNKLNARLSIPTEIEVISKIDEDILDLLEKHEGYDDSTNIFQPINLGDDFLPPNINLLQAFRCLLPLSQETEDVKQEPEYKKDLQNFVDRCKTMFQWPCVMSNLKIPAREERVPRKAARLGKIKIIEAARLKIGTKGTKPSIDIPSTSGSQVVPLTSSPNEDKNVINISENNIQYLRKNNRQIIEKMKGKIGQKLIVIKKISPAKRKNDSQSKESPAKRLKS